MNAQSTLLPVYSERSQISMMLKGQTYDSPEAMGGQRQHSGNVPSLPFSTRSPRQRIGW